MEKAVMVRKYFKKSLNLDTNNTNTKYDGNNKYDSNTKYDGNTKYDSNNKYDGNNNDVNEYMSKYYE